MKKEEEEEYKCNFRILPKKSVMNLITGNYQIFQNFKNFYSRFSRLIGNFWKKIHELWSCILKVMNFLSWLPYFGVKLENYFNFWKLLGRKKNMKFLLKIFHSILHYTIKFHEFWRCILGDMNCWSKQPCFSVKFGHSINFCGALVWGKILKILSWITSIIY